MTERRDDTLCDTAPLLVLCPANIDGHITLARDSGESLLHDIIRNEGCVMESAMRGLVNKCVNNKAAQLGKERESAAG